MRPQSAYAGNMLLPQYHIRRDAPTSASHPNARPSIRRRRSAAASGRNSVSNRLLQTIRLSAIRWNLQPSFRAAHAESTRRGLQRRYVASAVAPQHPFRCKRTQKAIHHQTALAWTWHNNNAPIPSRHRTRQCNPRQPPRSPNPNRRRFHHHFAKDKASQRTLEMASAKTSGTVSEVASETASATKKASAQRPRQ